MSTSSVSTTSSTAGSVSSSSVYNGTSTSSLVKFSGLATNINTEALIQAIINQESQPMVRMQNQQATNTTKIAALTTLGADLTSLNASLDNLVLGGFQANKVTSSDSTNQYVSATATGAASGTYNVAVKALATRARIVLPTAMQPTSAVGQGTYTLTDMAGNTFNVNVDSTNNTLAGLAAAINSATDAKGDAIDVNASVIQTGANGTSQLVLSANSTGLGASGAATFTLQAPAGSALDPSSQGTFTSTAATNADFFLNGVEMQRTSNTVSDAAQGVTFNLNAPQTNLALPTTFTVSMDTAAATTAMQGVVTAYNQFYKDYTSNTKFTKNSDGSYTAGVFNMDMSVRNIVQQVSNALMSPPSGLSTTSQFNSPAAIGLKTNQDGTLSLNTTAFQNALTANPSAVQNIFGNSGTSTSPLLTFLGSGANTTTSPITFSVTQGTDGTYTGTFQNLMPDGTTQTNTLTSTDGTFYGKAGTALAGLTVQASAGATGTLQVSAGISSLTQGLDNALTSLTPGDIGGLISDLNNQNSLLNLQIQSQQNYLANSQASLENEYSKLESTVSSLQSASSSLSSLS